MTTELINLHRAAMRCDENEWHEAILKSASDQGGSFDGVPLPGFPSDIAQKGTNGQLAIQSLGQAFRFYTMAMHAYKNHGAGRTDARFLDFGAGWGRIWRHFIRDFHPDQMFACDVNPDFATFWSSDMLGATLDIGRAYDPLPYETASMDLIVSNSVFSHLSERLNLHSAREISRVLRPGGLFVGTTFGSSHLRRWKAFAQQNPEELLPQQRVFSTMTDDFDAAVDAYNAGKFVWLETGKQRTVSELVDYEVSAFNGDWIEANWSGFLKLVSFNNPDAGQPVFVVLKPAD